MSIKTPRGQIIEYTTKSGKVKTQLVWNPGFEPRVNQRYSRAQQWLDNTVVRWSDPYVPMLTGMLRKSGQLGTVNGTGLVEYIAPYARRQYYSPRRPGSETGDLRGPFWFERMKAARKDELTAKVKQMAGGGG